MSVQSQRWMQHLLVSAIIGPCGVSLRSFIPKTNQNKMPLFETNAKTEEVANLTQIGHRADSEEHQWHMSQEIDPSAATYDAAHKAAEKTAQDKPTGGSRPPTTPDIPDN